MYIQHVIYSVYCWDFAPINNNSYTMMVSFAIVSLTENGHDDSQQGIETLPVPHQV